MTAKRFLLILFFYLPLFTNADTTLVSFNDSWRFFDLGYLPNANWSQIGYNDSTWVIGNGEFGYGDGDETTIINYGSDPNNKYIITIWGYGYKWGVKC